MSQVVTEITVHVSKPYVVIGGGWTSSSVKRASSPTRTLARSESSSPSWRKSHDRHHDQGSDLRSEP